MKAQVKPPDLTAMYGLYIHIFLFSNIILFFRLLIYMYIPCPVMCGKLTNYVLYEGLSAQTIPASMQALLHISKITKSTSRNQPGRFVSSRFKFQFRLGLKSGYD